MILIESLSQLNTAVLALQDEPLIALDFESTSLDVIKAQLTGIGFGTDAKTYFIPFPTTIDRKDIDRAFERLFENKAVIFHNAKYDMKLMIVQKLPLPRKFHDTMIMSWLVDSNAQHGLKVLAKEILGKSPKKFTQLKSVDLFTSERDVLLELAQYCCDDVANTFQLYHHFLPIMKKEGLDVAYEKVELRFVQVLIMMELRGIQVDHNWLRDKAKEAGSMLRTMEAEMVLRVRERFPELRDINVRSTKQLQEILFDLFEYKSSKDTASGKKSTDNEALEALVKAYNLQETDFVPLLLKFRDLDKLNGTYYIGLSEHADERGIVRANFLQHGTRTGRLSSSEPNLQNIPARHDEWDVRHAFIPREGYKFVIADYSQIELRMLAHFSRDEHMMETFINGGDIHAKTMELVGITERRIAKNVNFGIVYGVGPRTLSALINRPEEESKQYIDNFLKGYPGVSAFIKKVQAFALRYGYVEMITGRRRYFHEFKDNKWFNAVARQAVNTKIQGSAADLIKIAMIKLTPPLRELNAQILVQIHDEIIVETPIDKVAQTLEVVKETMDTALKLRVPVEVSIGEYDRWIKG